MPNIYVILSAAKRCEMVHLERFLRSVGDGTRSSSAVSDAARPCFPRVVRRAGRAAALLAPPAGAETTLATTSVVIFAVRTMSNQTKFGSIGAHVARNCF